MTTITTIAPAAAATLVAVVVGEYNRKEDIEQWPQGKAVVTKVTYNSNKRPTVHCQIYSDSGSFIQMLYYFSFDDFWKDNYRK